MNQITLINSTNIPESLVEAVINQFGGWDDFTESAKDVVEHSIDAGYGDFIYHADTVRFAANNLAAILNYAKGMADDLGQDGAYSLIAGFNCLPDYSADEVAEAIHTHSVNDDQWNDQFVQVMNALAWFAAEEVCWAYCDLRRELDR